jgi:tRNA(Ile)-lysidine synthase
VPKTSLIRIVQEWGLQWHEDVTNQDTSIERNFVRYELLPKILAKFPNAKNGLCATMQSLWSGAT